MAHYREGMSDQEAIKLIAKIMTRSLGEEMTEGEVVTMLANADETPQDRLKDLDDGEEMADSYQEGTKPVPEPGTPEYLQYQKDTIPYEYGGKYSK